MKRVLENLFVGLFATSLAAAQTAPAPDKPAANPPAAAGEKPQAQPATPGTAPEPVKAEASFKVLEIVGKVRYRINPESPWQMLTVDSPISAASEFQTGAKSQVKVQIGTNSEVTLQGLGTLTIGQVEVKNEDQTIKTRLGQKYGRMNVEVHHIGEFRNDYQISTPGMVLAVKGSGGWMSQYGPDWEIEWKHGNLDQFGGFGGGPANSYQSGDQGNNNNPNPQDNQNQNTNINNTSNNGPPGFIFNPNDGYYGGPNTGTGGGGGNSVTGGGGTPTQEIIQQQKDATGGNPDGFPDF